MDKNENVLGTIGVMYKGANDIEYRIRHIDAYIFSVFIKEEYRHNGYAGIMIKKLGDYLETKGIDDAYLAVSIKNKNAIRAYKKVGFEIVNQKIFLRVLKINVPYHKL